MKVPLIAGNWKMNLRRKTSAELACCAVQLRPEGIDLVICPPAVYLDVVGLLIRGTPVALGSQEISPFDDGAYTGEVGGAMLADLGCRYAIVGHSERRQHQGESDALVNQKARAALRHGLTPIVCVGESLQDRQAGQTLEVIRRQFDGSLAGLSEGEIRRTVVAYEPIWAIGTGQVATPQQAQEVHADLRNELTRRYNSATAGEVRIIYGGSVKPDNARSILEQPDIDGALVGGASLDAKAFQTIAKAATD